MGKRQTKAEIDADCKFLKLPTGTLPTPAQIRKSKELREEKEKKSAQQTSMNSTPLTLPKPTQPKIITTPIEPIRVQTITPVIPEASSSLNLEKVNVDDDIHSNNHGFNREDLERLIEEISKKSIHDALFGSGSKTTISGVS